MTVAPVFNDAGDFYTHLTIQLGLRRYTQGMTSPTIRVAAARAAFLFLAAASTSHADTQDSPPALSTAPGLPCAGPDEPAQETDSPRFTRSCPPTPAQLKLLHQSLEKDAPLGVASRPKYGLIIGGAATFGAVYLATAGLTALGNGVDCTLHNHAGGCGGERVLFVPVVGPLIHLAKSDQVGAWFFGPGLVMSSLAQLTGLTLLVIGALVPERVASSASDRQRYSLAPYVSTTGGGLQALVRY